MNKQQLQQQIQYRTTRDTLAAQCWISSNGLNVGSFNTTHPKLLQAQQAAQIMLSTQAHMLSTAQIKTLELFIRHMAHKNTRIKLKPSAAYPVLNINTRINRQLFKLHKHL